MKKLLLFFLLIFSLSTPAKGFEVPGLSGPVVDQAKMLSARTERELSQLIRQVYQQKGIQLQIVTLKNLSGLTIEQASIKIVDKWQLGDKKTDNGVLLLVAQKERKVRIEVGQGLEGDLPDAYAKRIIAETIIPLFKAGKFEEGIVWGAVDIIKTIKPDFKPAESYSAGKRNTSGIPISKIFIFIIIMIFSIFNRIGFGRGRGFRSGFGGVGGFGGSGGFGGGGWSGGGGGFSGGGASGGW